MKQILLLAAACCLAIAADTAAAEDVTAMIAREDAQRNALSRTTPPTAYSEPGNFTVAGSIGIGTETPAHKLHLYNPTTATTRFRLENAAGAVDMLTVSGAWGVITGGTLRVRLLSNGLLGVGTSNPIQSLHVYRDSTASTRVRIENNEGFADVSADQNGLALMPGGVNRLFIDSSGNVGIGTTAPGRKLDVRGETATQILRITGGSDLSEHFDIANHPDVQPGMVACIDPTRPGALAISTRAYDPCVAGVISGAGGVAPGMIMGHQGTIADGRYPVALSGRVYVLADATQHEIVPGDFLTTSDTPGHAMKAVERDRALGATLGKAMTPLPKGEKGLVLLLVMPQ